MRFEPRLAMLDACCARAQQLAEGLGGVAGLRVNPATPQVNMMHLHVDAPVDALLDARDAFAEAHRCWLFGAARATEVPGWSCIELTVGDQLLGIDNAAVLAGIQQVLEQARRAG
jgi:hypothetical protein